MSEAKSRVPRWLPPFLAGAAVALLATFLIPRGRSPETPGPEQVPSEGGATTDLVYARRLRIEPPPSLPETGGFRFDAREVPQSYFTELDVVQDRLWLSANGGVAVIDPVNESWTWLDFRKRSQGPVGVIPCPSGVWLQLSDSEVARLTLETRRYQISGRRQGFPAAPFFSTRVLCGNGAAWVYNANGRTLFQVPESGMVSERYEILWSVGDGVFAFAESLEGGVYFLDATYRGDSTQASGVFRFDPDIPAFVSIPMPGNSKAIALSRTDEGLLVRTRDSKSFLLRTEGKPWEEVPDAANDIEPVLAEGDSVVWVGASYDVHPGSYFVLRYIRDTMAPEDLVILPSLRAGAVHYLGMLWAVSGNQLLRIDPVAREIVSYTLGSRDPARGGIIEYSSLDKKSFPLDENAVPYFDGQRVLPAPPSPESSDLGEEPER